MKDAIRQRIQAVQRFMAGEKPESICASMGRSRSWLYKWLNRHTENDDAWCSSLSTRPNITANRTPA